MNEDIEYIAKRYKKGKFSVEEGWKRLNITPAFNWRTKIIAASVASVVVLTAAAAVIVYQHSINNQTTTNSTTEKTIEIAPEQVVKVIDFENTPLPVVIAKIKDVYGVEIVNIPENAEDYNLSLHYEGNAIDLITTINEIFDTQMEVKK